MAIRASSCGYMVPILSLSEKLNVGGIFILALFDSELESSVGGRATDITLEGGESVLPGVARITLIVPKGALEETSLRGPNLDWPPCPLG